MREFVFISDNEPSEEVLKDFRRTIARGVINKYGVDVMREIIKIKKSETTNDK